MRPASMASGRGRPGITLLEVLVAIFITGVGLLALLTLFPLGALNMAKAIKDDRAAAVATDAATFSEKGRELLERTNHFIVIAAVTNSADPKMVGDLKAEFEKLAEEAAGLEERIRQLRPLAQTLRAKRLVDQTLARIRAIQASLDAVGELLGLLLQPN